MPAHYRGGGSVMTIDRFSDGTPVPMITTWVCADGVARRIEDCSREDLIAAVRELSGQFAQFYSPRAIRQRAIGAVEMLKRGLER